MFCTKCGNQLYDEAVICPKCGCATSNSKSSNSSGNEMLDICIPEVKKQLKSPASAIFCSPEELVIKDNGGEYVVEGYVSSQNSYGALIKNDFSCNLVKSGNTYYCRSCSVGVKAAGQRNANFVINYIWISILTIIGAAIIGFIIEAMV